jgi:hypothetical protein
MNHDAMADVIGLVLMVLSLICFVGWQLTGDVFLYRFAVWDAIFALLSFTELRTSE